MEHTEKKEKIIDIVCSIDISEWKYNDYGNRTSFCETEFNGAKIKLRKTEKPDATCYVTITIDQVDFLGGQKAIEKYNSICLYHNIAEEERKLNEIDTIYNKLYKKNNSVTA